MAIDKRILNRTLTTPYGTHAYTITETLHDAGYDTWWVGGGVRDMLMGNIPADIDIATDALPAQIEKLFKNVHMQSAALGSVRVPMGNDLFEVTTFREDDTASDGRHPESVRFGKRETDATRRDFTINAIYFHPISSNIYDPFNGRKDLEEKLIRFILDPYVRIRHDALRILRAVRFRAGINGQYHPDTYAALRELAELIKPLSGQRKFEELEKLLKGPNPARGLEDQWELGILPYYLPELYSCKGIPQPADYHHEGDVWDHLLACCNAFREEHHIDVRIAALFHDIGKAETFAIRERIRFDEHASVSGDLTKNILERLNCPAKRREKIIWLVKHHMMVPAFLEMSDERKAHWYFHPWFPELLQLFWLDIAGTEPSDFTLFDAIVRNYNHFLDAHPRPPKPLLDGEEIMDVLGLKPGEKIGEILKELHDAQVKQEVTSKEEARQFIAKFIK
ncbi:MAG: polynucleotide adenylyltransferase/metal dependent phosphohydrolase [Candidatus Peribacteria bacterium]|nr:polynucleotide adenylyltransferase/metal dependent phosphohydrolase [Candidatus Peribacteria bacterium]